METKYTGTKPLKIERIDDMLVDGFRIVHEKREIENSETGMFSVYADSGAFKGKIHIDYKLIGSGRKVKIMLHGPYDGMGSKLSVDIRTYAVGI